jgi:hypothetical protein
MYESVIDELDITYGPRNNASKRPYSKYRQISLIWQMPIGGNFDAGQVHCVNWYQVANIWIVSPEEQCGSDEIWIA